LSQEQKKLEKGAQGQKQDGKGVGTERGKSIPFPGTRRLQEKPEKLGESSFKADPTPRRGPRGLLSDTRRLRSEGVELQTVSERLNRGKQTKREPGK